MFHTTKLLRFSKTDSKLQWSNHIANASSKALKVLNAIKIIKKCFTKKELLQLVTSNVFSILYYNSKIWHLPSLKSELKQKLLSMEFGWQPCSKVPVIFLLEIDQKFSKIKYGVNKAVKLDDYSSDVNTSAQRTSDKYNNVQLACKLV